MDAKTAVLVHGYNVNARDWEHVVWGDPRKGILGRASRGLQSAVRNGARLIYWGGAGSEKDGRKESEYTYAYAMGHAHELLEFRGRNLYEIHWSRDMYIDVEARNTHEEILNCARECGKREIEQLIVVSSPPHMSRCFNEANSLRLSGKLGTVRTVVGISADTYWSGSKPGDVVIFEPPCPSKNPKHPLHDHVRPILSIPRERVPDFIKELDVLVAKYL